VADKKALLDKALENAQPEAKRLTDLLLERRRLASVPEIAEQFQSLLLQEKGIVVADVTTAVPIDAAGQQMIQKQLSELVGKDVELRTQVDPAIIGGMVARIGDNLIDGSVSNQLRRLHERLTTSNV
jgi:F-type H+-transporting ATPase subunit delta